MTGVTVTIAPANPLPRPDRSAALTNASDS